MIKLIANGVPTATVSAYTYEIVEKLCKHYCTNGEFKPIVTRTWNTASSEVVNGYTFFEVQCVVTVTYMPKNGCKCCSKTNTFVETFEVSFLGSTGGTIAFTDISGYTEPSYTNCNNCNVAQGIKNVGNVTITYTAA